MILAPQTGLRATLSKPRASGDDPSGRVTVTAIY